jgi:membrane fusion protein (multidrug efflux system)
MKDDLREDEIEAKTSNTGRRWMALALIVLLAGGAGAVRYYLAARHYEKTDDAFLQATVTAISPRVSGQAVRVLVVDNQPVKAGDLLVEIDPKPLEAELERVRAAADLARTHAATAQLNVGLTRDTTGADMENSQAQVEVAAAAALQAQAAVQAAESDAVRAKDDAKRYEGLLKDKIVSEQQRDASASASVMADARLAESRKGLTAAEAQVQAARARLTQSRTAPQQIAVTESQVRQFEAELAQAEAWAKKIELDLSYTRIYAPADGIVTRKAVHEGENVQAGQALFAVVENDLWVEANFKETQLTDMRVGQRAEIEVDAFPGRAFKGHVQSIQSGTGSQFSLLPPQNATGNYVKVVQRVPVKIVFDEALPAELPLVIGMSVVPRVLVR